MRPLFKKAVVTLTAFCGGLLVLLVTLILAIYLSSVTVIMAKWNPDQTHAASLTRYAAIDVNFIVVVDGQRVYFSPDFAPVDLDFREQIAWDKTGQLVILEVAGRRIFGYDVIQKRDLNDDELLAAEYPPFDDYHFEGTLPLEQK